MRRISTAGTPDLRAPAVKRRGRGRLLAPALAAGLAAVLPGLPLAAQDATTARVQVEAPSPSRGWLGVSVTVTRTSEDPTERVVITDVWKESPAQAAGLRAGDRVLRVNGVEVTGERFRSMSQRLQPGDPMALEVMREGGRLQLTVVAGERPGVEVLVPQRLQEELDQVRGRLVRILEESKVDVSPEVAEQVARIHFSAPTILVERLDGDSLTTRVLVRADSAYPAQELRIRVEASAPRARTAAPEEEFMVRPLAPFVAGMNRVAGAEMRPLNPGLAAYFGVERGVLVTAVADDTPAHQAGLRGGDVVVSVRGVPVASLDELRAALARHLPEATLQVVRKGDRLELRLR